MRPSPKLPSSLAHRSSHCTWWPRRVGVGGSPVPASLPPAARSTSHGAPGAQGPCPSGRSHRVPAGSHGPGAPIRPHRPKLGWPRSQRRQAPRKAGAPQRRGAGPHTAGRPPSAAQGAWWPPGGSRARPARDGVGTPWLRYRTRILKHGEVTGRLEGSVEALGESPGPGMEPRGGGGGPRSAGSSSLSLCPSRGPWGALSQT